jgi:flagellar operon protein
MSTPIRPVSGPGSTQQVQAPQKTQKTGQPSFGAVLERTQEAQEPLKLSQHAQARLDSRRIGLTGEDWNVINQAVDLAGTKGVRNSLVLKGQVALVVNVPNRTVVTAVDTDLSQEKVFTNIDGAVIL